MTFEVKVQKVELSPEENQRRIARIVRWLLAVCGDLLGKGKATENIRVDQDRLLRGLLEKDQLDEILEMSQPGNSKTARKR